MASKVGTLIKEARTAKGLTQEQLAKRIAGLSAADISKAERGEKNLTQDQLKQIAKITGVTQKSLLDAAKEGAAKPASAAKTGTAKTAAKKPAAKKPATPAGANSTMKVTATERKLVDAYRAATGDQKKAAMKVLKGECDSQLSSLLNTTGSVIGDAAQDILGGLVNSLLGGK